MLSFKNDRLSIVWGDLFRKTIFARNTYLVGGERNTLVQVNETLNITPENLLLDCR